MSGTFYTVEDIPRLVQENRELRARVAELLKLIERLEKEVAGEIL